MKVPVHLIVALLAAVSCSSSSAEQTSKEQRTDAGVSSELSRAAAAQLERLSGFRRSGMDTSTGEARPTRASSPSGSPGSSKKPSQISSEEEEDELQLRIPIDFGELFRIFSESSSGSSPRDKRNDVQLTPDRMRALDKYADKLLQDERVQSYMRERIKRDGAYGGYGGYGAYGPPPPAPSGSGGSGAFVSGLAGQLVGSVVGLSSSASKTSSSSSGHQPAPVYGPPVYHPYGGGGKAGFGIWDIKRAILNTLIQAVKAIGGGVLALKGQLIKGSGFLVSTKGRIISSAGEAITGLGKSLASSAVVQPPPPAHPGYANVGYAYEAPAAHIIAHDTQYEGPPPSPDAYHSTFTAASDVVYAYAYYPRYGRYRKTWPMG